MWTLLFYNVHVFKLRTGKKSGGVEEWATVEKKL